MIPTVVIALQSAAAHHPIHHGPVPVHDDMDDRDDEGNIIVQTDGGRREADCAAAAWIIGIYGKYGYEPLVAHGTFLTHTTTVFLAEGLALDEASSEVELLMSNTST